MSLKSLFQKPVDRPIEGVIKADDEACLRLELEEYVITHEVEKRLEAFFDAYNNYENANGVWVSGFFGSGKSHLLKILALLLENRQVENVHALDLFLEKCKDNEILKGDLTRAVSIPSKSILFNIDQKADIISKTEIDALIAVFVKVFDEHCGYYGKHSYIAQFERELDADGLFDKFKENFLNKAGNDWDWGRQRAKRMAAEIDAAYNQVTGQNTKDILDKYRLDYRLSIEDFADQVKVYIDKQGKDFRLNFFVDEVGQFVADNVKLMTNLQTVAESLATKCRGRAWVIVTAQEDMNSVVGEMGKQQSNDFSKIQARFSNRMKLTSQDVAEVIQRRLLKKNEEGVAQLSDLFHQQENNFKTLFDFSDGTQAYQNYRDREHFIQAYPFIPYQFALFQSAIQNLSLHNAFEGKHSSVGERSMLGVFQQVAIQIADHEVGQLATFDLMFEGIRTALKTGIQQSILRAENNLNNPFAVRLLKVLFLVKYVKEFKPTIRNLCVLMHDSFSRNIPALKTNVEEALNLLEQQTYIQRNAEQYQFLTDEEQDIEQEIKNTEVETKEVTEELEKLIFDGVLKTRKIRWDENGQDYPFSRRLDDNLFGREYELAINVITPFHEHADKIEKHRTDTAFQDELRVLLPVDDLLVRDLLMYKRTEKYVNQEIRTTQQESIKRILSEKREQNNERLDALKTLTGKLISRAKYFVAGHEIELSGEDGQSKIAKAFYDLIKRTYTHLRMLRGITYNENDIANILQKSQEGIFTEGETSLPESQQEMLSIIQGNDRSGIRTTVKSVLEKFEKKPYGWSFAAVLCTLAYLCARGKVEMRESSNLLENADLVRALRNTATHGNLIINPQVEFTASQVRALKEFFAEYFDGPPHANEAKALATETEKAFQEQKEMLVNLAAKNEQYPFLRALQAIVTDIKEIVAKPYAWFLIELIREEDKWLDLKEQTIDPIRKFMSGPQKDIYDEARKVLQEQKANIEYIVGDEFQKIEITLVDPQCFKGNKIQQVKILLDSLTGKIEQKIVEERTSAAVTLEALQQKLSTQYEYKDLSPEQQQLLNKPFDDIKQQIENQTLIAVIRDRLRDFEEQKYSKLLMQIIEWNQPTYPEIKHPDVEKGKTEKTQAIKPHVPEVILGRSIKVNFSQSLLTSEADVESYIDLLKKALLEEIRKGKRVQI